MFGRSCVQECLHLTYYLITTQQLNVFVVSVQTDAEVGKEQKGNLIVRPGAPDGGARGWVVGQGL